MKTLLLLRHAKSSWDEPSLDDFDRPLSARGRRDAPRIGRWIAEHELAPDLALVSPARRTRETWSLVEPELGKGDVRVEFDPALYLASPAEMLTAVRAAPEAAERLLVLAHNPGTQALALLLSSGDEAARRAMHAKFPTAALAVLDFDVDRWLDAGPGGARLRAFVRPRDLP
ncbi:MAG: histidine phosphatase family protein [Gemmatimonadetes bacterium]|nr:MAG: histidine phosphatase family protein [Gemmatimonadota bacterium]